MVLNKITKCIVGFFILQSISVQCFSQSNFDPQKLFAPFAKETVTPYRSANGAPGPSYWQNRVNYKIDATLDTLSNVLAASETIEYINNSPDALNSLWLQLDQNIYKEDSRSDFSFSKFSPEHTQGYQFKKITVNGEAADYIITDTRMQIRLKKALDPNKKLNIDIQYQYEVPGIFGGRTDFFSTRYGKIYEIAQWYPRMCVYDDMNGWNTLPFLGTGEFYCEYGDFDYSITLPSNMYVAASGELVNEKDVYSSEQLKRWKLAKESDKTIYIRTAAEMQKEVSSKKAGASANKTWHFKMQNSRDVAFAASATYIIDAAGIHLPEGKKALAVSVYPIESAGKDRWDRSTEYLKKSIEYFSEKWLAYPYPVAINAAGKAGGMEYPGILFDGMNSRGKGLYWVTAHEIGHTWFPMIVGSSERRHAWMDEGFNTFIDVLASDNFNHGEFAPKRDGEYAPGGGNPSDEIIPWLKDTNAPSMMLRADMITGKYRHPFSYFKPALGLVLLRDAILDSSRFDYAFKQYIHRWAYKHPGPDDFFRTMESEAGEDLSYFWRQWFKNNWLYDISIESVTENKQGSLLVIRNLEKSAYPCELLVGFKNGQSQKLKIPVEVWLNGDKYSLQINNSSPVTSVQLDPGKKLPDMNRENNQWKK